MKTQFILIFGFFLSGPSYTQSLTKVNTDNIKQKWLDVSYAIESPAQKLDVYLPNEGDGPFPVILSIHGGAFRAGDKGDSQVMPMLEGIKRGYTIVSVTTV